ncbi:cell envelope integrity protein TolA [Variovorax sp. Sphag1AA]|uniref:cell envelope integrity protein TolA n=1 Tax=Variovorax sp. Sphag1AA TaxID=2587027 RepID=UPI00161AD012|nr:cell envelope integrity protein TolA [Variovorax sp. Sphag1AA]MBB3175964.1 colicin import membrane protein [Variovorax sp. Sphag1AA]
MSLAAERPEFAPPPQRGTLRAVLLALFAHALLIALLTWGVSWRREAENDAVEAELWSSTVQQAAPRAVSPPTPTPPPPVPTPAPPPPPPPPPPQAAKPPEPTPTPRQPDIALEREKKLKEQKERELEQQRVEQQKKLEAQKKADQQKKEAEARKREEEEAERKKDEQKKLADQKRKQEAEAKQQADAAKKKEADAKQAAQAAADRAATLKRMQALAGTGNENSTGTAARSSGPSGSYAGKVQAAVRPNVVFPDADLVSGNPSAEFDVRLAPDGTIVGTPQITKSSGNSSWDQAALRALQKTEKLPRDIDGTVPARLIISLKPKG